MKSANEVCEVHRIQNSNVLKLSFICILLFIVNISRGLIGLEMAVKSSYPLGTL